MLNDIFAVEVIVRNLSKSIKWYKEKLGAKLVSNYGKWKCVDLKVGKSKVVLELGQPIKALGSFEYKNEKKMIGKPTGIIFLTNDIDSTYQKLKKRGVKFVMSPKKQRFGDKVAIFADPDGNQFKIFEE